MKTNSSATVEENGAIYAYTESVAFKWLCRIIGSCLIFMGVLMLLVQPIVGVLSAAFGLWLIIKLSKHAKKQFVSITDKPLAGSATFGEWDEKVHHAAAQSDRFERARHEAIDMLDYNSATGVASISGSSGEKYTATLDYCSCPDFEKRSKPCKHIYFLAIQLGFSPDDFYS